MERVVRDAYGSMCSSEIQPLQWSILRYLDAFPKRRCTMSLVAAFLGLTHAPVVRAISTLVKRGLVEQVANPEDARSKLLVLSKTGVEMLHTDPILKIVERLWALPEIDLITFKKSIRAMALSENNGDKNIR